MEGTYFLLNIFPARAPGRAKSSLVSSQDGQVPLLYPSAKQIIQECKETPQSGEERHSMSQKIHMDTYLATYEKVNILLLKIGCH